MSNAEFTAVGTATCLFAESQHLVPSFNTSDSGPFTDGHIDLYEGDSRAKDTFVGRLDVQIKGRKRLGKTFSLDRATLEGFQKLETVLFVAIRVDPQKTSQKNMYALLTPPLICKLLSESTNKFRIPLKQLPKHPDELKRIVEFGISTKRLREHPNKDPLASLTTLQIKSAQPINYTEDEIFLTPETADFYMLDGENEIEGFAFYTPVVLRRIRSIGTITIQVGEIKLETRGEIYEKEKLLVLRLTDWATFKIFDNRAKLELAPHPNVPYIEIYQIYTLVNALLDTGTITVNGIPHRYKSNTPQDSDDISAHLANLRELQEVANELKIDTTILYPARILASEWNSIHAIHGYFYRGQPLSRPISGSSRFQQSLGGLELALVIQADEGEDVKLGSLFDCVLWIEHDGSADNNSGFWATGYDLLTQEEIERCGNLCPDQIVSAYSRLPSTPNNTSRLEWLIEYLLRCTGEHTTPNYHAAIAAEVGSMAQGAGLRSIGIAVRTLQAVSMLRPLDSKELDLLISLRKEIVTKPTIDDDLDNLITISALLGSRLEVERLLDGLTHDKIEEFCEFSFHRLLSNAPDDAPSV
ncbi:hypothetical protein [Bowdeniella nasicola]|uniref:hypothetical protein n=1 Tax=Bowdeniella nasicola TaxID=208480 RepID=UPI00115FDC5D|nr:hypothetical protein [Bowdeniella nasicola]